MKSASLVSSAAVPPTSAERRSLGESAATARSTGQRPRRETRKGSTLPPLVSVPSKSKAATVRGGIFEPPAEGRLWL